MTRRPPGWLEKHVAWDDIVTCLPVIQETLQGIDDERLFRESTQAFGDLPIVESPLTRPVVDEAVSLYRAARRRGLTIRSSVDCLIASCALRNGLTVMHRDRDFDALAKVAGLQVKSA